MSRRLLPAVVLISTAAMGCLGNMKTGGLFSESLPSPAASSSAKPETAAKFSSQPAHPASDDKPVARGKMPTTKLDDRSPVSAGDLTSANVREKLEAIKAELAEASQADDEPKGSSDQ